MVKTIIKVLLLGTLGISVLILIPDLFLPITSAIDRAMDSNMTLLMTNIYSGVALDVLDLLVMQGSTLIISVLVRMIFHPGGK